MSTLIKLISFYDLSGDYSFGGPLGHINYKL